MMPSLKTLGIDQLSREARVALVHEIWDTIAAESQAIPLSEAQQTELERRLVEDEAIPDDVVPWEKVKRDALARLKS